MYEYFKSDDEGILSSDDEWWLGRNKPLIEQEEPPSGKTRLIRGRPVGVASKHFDLDSTHLITGKGSPQEEETLEARPRSWISWDETTAPTALSSSLTPVCPVARTFGDSPMLKTSDFPALSGAHTNPGPPTATEECSSRLADGPWKNARAPSALTKFPSLRSTARPQPSTTRFICSYSSATTQASNGTSTATPRAKETKRTVADLRDESLKATLPAFKLDDPAFKPQTITMCPTEQHPISELPLLLKSLSHDGLTLPSGRPELEGGPYVAIGFDMEWTISRIKGHENKTAVIQLASRSQVLIVQISSDGPWRTQGIMPPSLVDFLANPQIVKIGVGIRNDGLKLIRDHRLGPKPFLNSFLELSRLARAFSQPDCYSGYSRLISLQQIVADHLKVYLPKVDTRTSDWTKPLEDAQIEYAASDVVATIRVAKQLFNLFEGRIRKADSGLMILQYIESLEPTFERSASPTQPPVPPKQKDSSELPKTKAKPFPKPKGTANSTGFPNRMKPPTQTESMDLLIPISNAADFPNLKDTAKPPLKDPPRQIKKSFGPFPASHKQWRTFLPATGPQSVEVTKQWVTKPAKFLAASLKPLKKQVSLKTQQAWELWYHEGNSINSCANAMGIRPMGIAIFIGKMLIHFKLNHLNLNEYYQKRIKARIANPQAFAELRISPTSQGDVAGEKAGSKCIKGDRAHGVPQGALPEHSQENHDQEKEPIRPSLSLHGSRPSLLRPHSSSFSYPTPTDDKRVVVRSPSLPSFPYDDKVSEAEQIVVEQSSCFSATEPIAKTVPLADVPSIDTTPEEVSVMAEALLAVSSDKGLENIPESGKTQRLKSGKNWFEETLKEDEQIDVAAADQPSQEMGELLTDQQGTGKAEAGKAEEEDKDEDSGRVKNRCKTKNFRVDDSEFMKNKSLEDGPLFQEDEWERIKEMNRKKAQLILAVVEGFRLPQRLHTSACYFQLESEP